MARSALNIARSLSAIYKFAGIILGVHLPGGGQRHEIGQAYSRFAIRARQRLSTRLRQHKGNTNQGDCCINSGKALIRIHDFSLCYPAPKSIGILNTHTAYQD